MEDSFPPLSVESHLLRTLMQERAALISDILTARLIAWFGKMKSRAWISFQAIHEGGKKKPKTQDITNSFTDYLLVGSWNGDWSQYLDPERQNYAKHLPQTTLIIVKSKALCLAFLYFSNSENIKAKIDRD